MKRLPLTPGDEYGLTLVAAPELTEAAVATLADLLRLDHVDARNKLAALPDKEPVLVGLDFVLEELRDHLAAAGITSSVAKLDPSPAR